MFDAELHECARITASRTMVNSETLDPLFVLVVRHNRRGMTFSNQASAQSDVRSAENVMQCNAITPLAIHVQGNVLKKK